MIKDDLDEKFRETVYQRKGMHKGNITEAVEEAIDQWIKNVYCKGANKNERK